jgi:hypothetical protein
VPDKPLIHLGVDSLVQRLNMKANSFIDIRHRARVDFVLVTDTDDHKRRLVLSMAQLMMKSLAES